MTAAYVQSAAATSGTASFASNTTIGNCLIACVQAYGASSISAVTTGSSGDHWTQVKALTGGLGQVIAIWIDPACTVSNSSVTFTASGGTSLNIQAYELSGMGNAPVLDVEVSRTQSSFGSTTSWTSGTTSSAGATDLRLGMYAGNYVSVSGNYTVTAPTSPWNCPEGVTTQQAGSVQTNLVSGYYIPGTSGTVTFSSTSAITSTFWAAIAMAITPGSTGGGGSAGSFLPFFA